MPAESVKRSLFASTVALLLSATAALPATFTVNDNGDAGDALPGDGRCLTAANRCTLRAAIEEANQTGGNEVVIPAMTITLGAPLVVQAGLTIRGAGRDTTIIDGNHAVRVLDAVQSTLNLFKLTVRNGLAPTSRTDLRSVGGGCVRTDGQLTLIDVKAEGCQAAAGGASSP